MFISAVTINNNTYNTGKEKEDTVFCQYITTRTYNKIKKNTLE